MNSSSLGWRPLIIVVAVLAIFVLAAGCQQKQEPAKPEGNQPAGPTAQMPQNMLDALHGKQPEGGAQMTPPPGGMPPAGMAPAGMAQGGMAQGGAPGMPAGMPKVARQVVVSEAVKKGWKGVVVQVTEKGGASKDYQVAIHGKLDIPGSSLTVQVEEFLPDFKMTPQGITSVSNEPKNPAVKVVVVEGGKPVFKGWLFKMFPDAHPFQHPKYHLSLKNGVAA
jgi:hypothetical protein